MQGSFLVVEELDGKLRITIRHRPSGMRLLVGVAAAVIWFWVAGHLWELFSHPEDAGAYGLGDVLVFGFAVLWMIAGWNTLFGLMFEFAGREQLDVDGERLTIRRVVGLIGYRRVLKTALVRDVNVIDMTFGPYVSGITIGASRNGRVQLRYDNQSLRFGDGVSQQVAEEVVSLLDQQLARHSVSSGRSSPS